MSKNDGNSTSEAKSKDKAEGEVGLTRLFS